jgi:VWFA-related protein
MHPEIKRGRIALAAGIALLMTAFAFPQPDRQQKTEAQKQAAPQEERKKQVKPALESSPQGKDYKIGVNVDLVVVHTTVLDRNGKFVTDLKADGFKVFEDGVPQTILSFSQEDVPLSMGILIDISGSMRSKFDNVINAALALIRASNPMDEEFLLGFNDEVELIDDYTNDIDTIEDDLNNTLPHNGTALWDAIYLGVQKAQEGRKPKKAVIVISDGEDEDSYYKLDEMLAKVQESDVQVYAIGFLSDIPEKGLFQLKKSKPEKARDALQKISDETGGKAFFPKDIREIHDIVAQIALELRNQYTLTYTSTHAARDGTWRRIKVTLDSAANSGFKVRYRNGYFAPKPSAGK